MTSQYRIRLPIQHLEMDISFQSGTYWSFQFLSRKEFFFYSSIYQKIKNKKEERRKKTVIEWVPDSRQKNEVHCFISLYIYFNINIDIVYSTRMWCNGNINASQALTRGSIPRLRTDVLYFFCPNTTMLCDSFIFLRYVQQIIPWSCGSSVSVLLISSVIYVDRTEDVQFFHR